MDDLKAELLALRKENIKLKEQCVTASKNTVAGHHSSQLSQGVESLIYLTEFHHILKDLPYFLCLLDYELNILYVNKLLPGFTQDNLIGGHLFTIIPASDQDGVNAAYKRSIESKSSSNYIVNQPTADGNIHRISVTLQPIFDGDENIVRWLTTAHDVSKEILTKGDLWRSEQRYRALLESSPLAIVEWSPVDYSVKAWSPGAEKLFGYSEEESLLMKISEFTLASEAEQHRESVLDEFGKSQEITSSTMLSVCKDGSEIYCRWANVSIHNEHGELESMLSIGQDVSESELSLIQLARAKAEAEQLARDKSSFIATVSHELRTPMHGILNATEMLANELDENPVSHHLLDLIGESSHTLLRLINDVLDFSKAETGSFELNQEAVDVYQLLSNICALLEPETANKNIYLSLITEKKQVPVLVDSLRLRQVLYNLIGNAVKFTEHGGVEVSIRAEPEGQTHLDVLITVKDSGIGIAADRLGFIFESFVQADNSITRNYGGTGLGLAIGQRLAQLMGGEIAVESIEGVGSEFSLKLLLPIAELNVQTSIVEDKLACFQGVVMVVDDNPINITICTKQLEQLGLEVVTASNGEECIAGLQHKMVDLVLMDLQMPVLDGFSATRRIRQLGGQFEVLPIIAMTANRFEQAASYYQEIGLNDYMTKPFNSRVLAGVLKSVAPYLLVQ